MWITFVGRIHSLQCKLWILRRKALDWKGLVIWGLLHFCVSQRRLQLNPLVPRTGRHRAGSSRVMVLRNHHGNLRICSLSSPLARGLILCSQNSSASYYAGTFCKYQPHLDALYFKKYSTLSLTHVSKAKCCSNSNDISSIYYAPSIKKHSFCGSLCSFILTFHAKNQSFIWVKDFKKMIGCHSNSAVVS